EREMRNIVGAERRLERTAGDRENSRGGRDPDGAVHVECRGRRGGLDADVATEGIEHDVAAAASIDDGEVRVAGRAEARPRRLRAGSVAVRDVAGLRGV